MVDPQSVQNHLLGSLPAGDLARLLAGVDRVSLRFGEVLHAIGEPIGRVHFVESGMVSLIVRLDAGASEVGLVGREGLVGSRVASGGRRATSESLVQLEGEALSMAAPEFLKVLLRMPSLVDLLLRFEQASNCQVSQTVACNANHSVDQRLARWLLMVRDRAPSAHLPMTQEFLSAMLCVRRATVNASLSVLTRLGAIRGGRGWVEIMDRDILEDSVCECYAVVRAEYDRLLHPPRHKLSPALG